jgi:hypothetical protein
MEARTRQNQPVASHTSRIQASDRAENESREERDRANPHTSHRVPSKPYARITRSDPRTSFTTKEVEPQDLVEHVTDNVSLGVRRPGYYSFRFFCNRRFLKPKSNAIKGFFTHLMSFHEEMLESKETHKIHEVLEHCGILVTDADQKWFHNFNHELWRSGRSPRHCLDVQNRL